MLVCDYFSNIDTSDATSFNPCFSGCWSAIGIHNVNETQWQIVSILVLVDVGLRLGYMMLNNSLSCVSILVLVDVGLRYQKNMLMK